METNAGGTYFYRGRRQAEKEKKLPFPLQVENAAANKKRWQDSSKMKPLPYHPAVDMQQLHAFDEHLRTLRGSWNTIGTSFVHAGAPGVIRLRWQIPGERWCDEAGFLEFLDMRQHRLLLQAFLPLEVVKEEVTVVAEPDDPEAATPARDWRRMWNVESLLSEIGMEVKPRQMLQALRFLELQEYIVAHGSDEWMSSTYLEHIEDLGPTFAWSVQAHLQEKHHALARRCVSFREWETAQLNDLDVLAFTEDGLVVAIECPAKQALTPDHLLHFVQRARTFPADVSLLLIDTESEEQLTDYLQRINVILNRAPMNFGDRHVNEGSVVYHLAENFYVANTAGGIDPVLTTTLQLGSSFKQK
jgi:hypothetical protein